MTGWLVLVPVLLAAGAAPAAPAPPAQPAAAGTLRFQRLDRENRHSTMGFSMDHWLRTEVVLERQPDDAVRVVDRGERGDSSADRTHGYSAEVERWRTTWTGTWQPTPEGAALALRRQERTCRVTKRLDRTPDEQRPCRETETEVRLACRETTVRIGPDLLTPDAERRPEPAWECTPAGEDAAALDTPPPWIFGHTACVEATGARRATRLLRACQEPPPDEPPAP